MNTPTVAVTAHHLDVPGARLYYEVRGSGPAILLVGAPMDARSFAPLADRLADDHTVITTDPRGINRSRVDDRAQDSTPQVRADDLSRILAAVDAGPAAVLGSSGGAVSVLALAEAHPEQVHTVVAHEPPLNELLPDREELRAKTEEIIAIHRSGDFLGGMRKFLEVADIHMPEEVFLAVFGGERSPQDIADADYQNDRMLRPTTRWVPDIAALRASTVRIVVGIGDDSAGELCDRTSRALAAELGTEPTLFPGGHVGFADDPDTFVVRLREVLGRP